MYTVIQAVHSLLYICSKVSFFQCCHVKRYNKHLQKSEGCIHFCEILCIYIYIYIYMCVCVYIYLIAICH